MVSTAGIFCEASKEILVCSETVTERGVYVDLNWMRKELEEFPM